MQASEIPGFCPRCGTPNRNLSLFCDSCRLYLRDDTSTVERATYNRRFWGDSLLEGVLIVLTLVIGWFIWLIFTSRTGQTPAKRLLNVYVVRVDSGQSISQGETWVREVVVKFIVLSALNGALTAINQALGLVGLIDAVWIFADKNRQTLHDKVLSHVVVYAPAGLPESMQRAGNAPIQHRPVTGPAVPTFSTGAAGTGVTEMAAQLRELARLRDEGIITAEEYEGKRADLVEKM